MQPSRFFLSGCCVDEVYVLKSLIVILLVGFGSWHYMDLSSESGFHSVFAPIAFVISLIAVALWLVLVGGVTERVSSGHYFTSSTSSHFDGDCGGDEQLC